MRPLFSIFPVLLMSAPVLAHGADDHVRHAGVHIHGKGEAFLALSGGELVFDLTAPRANFVLANGGGIGISENSLPELSELIVLPERARCEPQSMSLDVVTIGGAKEHDHGEHEHDDHDHGHDHGEHNHSDDDHHDHSDEEHHEAHDHNEHAGHADLLLNAVLVCENPQHINRVDFTLFETYSGFETVDLVFATDEEMMATTLDKTKTRINRP